MKKYGITPADYERLLVAQEAVCAICKRPPRTETLPNGATRDRLNVDHDHRTGRVRGLLCAHCNKALGYFEDDAERIVAALEYLKRRPHGE